MHTERNISDGRREIDRSKLPRIFAVSYTVLNGKGIYIPILVCSAPRITLPFLSAIVVLTLFSAILSKVIPMVPFLRLESTGCVKMAVSTLVKMES